MIEQVLTTSKIIDTEHLDAAELDRLIFYCGGAGSQLVVIEDNRKFELRDKMLYQLSELRPVTRLNKVFPDPKVQDIMEMVDTLHDNIPNVIIGIGGGSTMDSAKAIAAVLCNGGSLEDYLGPNPSRKIEKRDIKLILIPTTAGTGAEVTKFGVYTSLSGRKYTLNNPLLQSDIALLVSEYIYNMPSGLKASTMFDALSHALETLWNKNSTPISDRVAIESAAYILQWIEVAYDNPVKGGGEMLLGACKAGISFNLTGTAAVHALSFILSEKWHIPHGVACAFSLEDVMQINMQDPETRKKLASVARKIGISGNETELVEGLLEYICKLKKKFQLPFTFSDLEINENLDELKLLFAESMNDPKMHNNIIPLQIKDISTLISNKCHRY